MDEALKCTVLIADAEPIARRGLVEIIREKPGYVVCGEVGDPRKIEERCAMLSPTLAILDPAQGNGFAILQQIPLWSAKTRIVVFTSLEDVASVQRAFRCGALGYVSRLEPPDVLLTALHEATNGSRYIGPRLQKVVFGELANGALQFEEGLLSRLSEREKDVYRLVGAGRGTRAIAEELSISRKTVETHRQRIRQKLGLGSGAELQKHAILAGNSETSSALSFE